MGQGMSELRDRLRWDDIEIFCQLAAHGSLRKAAQATDQSVETIRRRINALEIALGERLFRRTVQGLEMTATGREILAKAREAHDAIAAIARISGADRPRDARRLRLVLPEDVGALTFLPALAATIGAGDDSFDIRLLDPAAKPDWDGADIGLTYLEPERPDLRRRKIGQVEYGLFRRGRAGFAERAERRGGIDALLVPPDSHPVFSHAAFVGVRASRPWRTAWRVSSALAIRDVIAATDAAGLLPCGGVAFDVGYERADLDDGQSPSAALDLWLGFHADVGAHCDGRALIDRLIALAAPRSGLRPCDATIQAPMAGFHDS